MTTTIELIEPLEIHAKFVHAGGHLIASKLMERAAQRLRELDKTVQLLQQQNTRANDEVLRLAALLRPFENGSKMHLNVVKEST